jgi:hypothetical protein
LFPERHFRDTVRTLMLATVCAMEALTHTTTSQGLISWIRLLGTGQSPSTVYQYLHKLCHQSSNLPALDRWYLQQLHGGFVRRFEWVTISLAETKLTPAADAPVKSISALTTTFKPAASSFSVFRSSSVPSIKLSPQFLRSPSLSIPLLLLRTPSHAFFCTSQVC